MRTLTLPIFRILPCESLKSTLETSRLARRTFISGVWPSGAVTSFQCFAETIVTWRLPPWLALPTMPLPAMTRAV